MRVMHATLTLIILAMLVIGCTGSIGCSIESGHGQGIASATATANGNYHPGAADGKTHNYGLSVDNTVAAFYANVEDAIYNVFYVSRARSQVYQNDNRNAVLKFIIENPGSKLYDMSRLLNMNVGTLRYHLMILAVNHLVVVYQDGDRYVRFFTNTGTYSEEQMKAISLLQREQTNKLLGALAGNAGMTNSRLSLATGLSSSDVNRYLKELTSRGVVIKETISPRKHQYIIAPGLEEYVTGNIRQ